MHGHGARIENNIGDFLIQWLALCQQVANTCLWVCRLEQGAIAIARYTRIKLFRGRPQVNHHAPRFKHSSVLGSQHRAATRSQHQISLRRTLFEHRTFAPAEPFFTFDVEDVDNPNPTTAFDLVIEVEEVAPQHASQAATDGGLTGTHHPHQEYGPPIGQGCDNLPLIRTLLRGGGRYYSVHLCIITCLRARNPLSPHYSVT